MTAHDAAPSPVLQAYLDGARAAALAIAEPDVAARWDEPSSLANMSIGDLAAHLARSILLVEQFLDADEPAPAGVIGAGEYFGAMSALTDPDSELNAGIRQRSHEGSADGAAAVAASAKGSLDRLTERLASTPSERRVTAFGGNVMSLCEYLRTRCVELAVHLDDLSASGFASVQPPSSTMAVAIAAISEAARFRHGDLAVLRAMTRTERASPEALRVF